MNGNPQSAPPAAPATQPESWSTTRPGFAMAPDPRRKSPFLAGALSLFPGLGQVYLGLYVRGFVNAIVIAIVITLLATNELDELTPLFGFLLPFFWLYNVIDAARTAVLYNQALNGLESAAMPSDLRLPRVGGSIAGGVALIVIGAILLAHTRFGMRLEWVAEWWPVAPIALGAWLVFRAVSERRGAAAPGEASPD